MLNDLKSFLILKWHSLLLELVYCSIICFYTFDVSNDSSLYIVNKKMLKIFLKTHTNYTTYISLYNSYDSCNLNNLYKLCNLYDYITYLVRSFITYNFITI